MQRAKKSFIQAITSIYLTKVRSDKEFFAFYLPIALHFYVINNIFLVFSFINNMEVRIFLLGLSF